MINARKEHKEEKEKKEELIGGNQVASISYTLNSLVNFVALLPRQLEEEKTENLYVRLEQQQSLEELKLVISPIKKGLISEVVVEAMQRFLARRLPRLLYSYNETPHHPLTQICLLMATAVGDLKKLNRFQVLIPSLLSPDSFIGISLADPETQLQQFVLSDDGQYFIDVVACLDSAVDDGVLKHTQKLVDGRAVPLSKSEIERVSEHSKESKKYYKALQELNGFLKYGNSHGSALKNLADGLWEGGRSKQEKALQAKVLKERAQAQQMPAEQKAPEPLPVLDHEVEIAPIAVTAIESFYDYLAKLQDDERERLLACPSTNSDSENSPTLKILWARILSRYHLFVKKEKKIQIPEKLLEEYYLLLEAYPERSVPCIELYSNDINCVITANPHLLYGLEQFKQKCENLSNLLRRVTLQPQSKVKFHEREATPALWEHFIDQSLPVDDEHSPVGVTIFSVVKAFSNKPVALLQKIIQFLKNRVSLIDAESIFKHLSTIPLAEESIRELLPLIQKSAYEKINNSDQLPLDPIWAALILEYLIKIEARYLQPSLFIKYFTALAKKLDAEDLRKFLDRINKAWAVEQFKIRYHTENSGNPNVTSTSIISVIDLEKISLVVNFLGLENLKYLINNDLEAFGRIVNLVKSEKLSIFETVPFFNEISIYLLTRSSCTDSQRETFSKILTSTGDDFPLALKALGKEFLLDQALGAYPHLISKFNQMQIRTFNSFLGWEALNAELDKEQKHQPVQKKSITFYDHWSDVTFNTIFNTLSLKNKLRLLKSIYYKSRTEGQSLALLLNRARDLTQLVHLTELLLIQEHWSEYLNAPRVWIETLADHLSPAFLAEFLKQLPEDTLKKIREFIITKKEPFRITIKNIESFYVLFDFCNLGFLKPFFRNLTGRLVSEELHAIDLGGSNLFPAPESFELINWSRLILEKGCAAEVVRQLSFPELKICIQAQDTDFENLFARIYLAIPIDDINCFLNISCPSNNRSPLYQNSETIARILLAIQNHPAHFEAFCKKVKKENENYSTELYFVTILSINGSSEEYQAKILLHFLTEDTVVKLKAETRFFILRALEPKNRARFLIFWPKSAINDLSSKELSRIISLIPPESSEVAAIFLKPSFLKNLSLLVNEEKPTEESTETLALFFSTPDVITSADLAFFADNFDQPPLTPFLGKFLSRFYILLPHVLELIGKDVLAKHCLKAGRDIIPLKGLSIEQRENALNFLGWKECDSISDIVIPEYVNDQNWLHRLSYREFKIIFNSLDDDNRKFFFSQIKPAVLFIKIVSSLNEASLREFLAIFWLLFKSHLEFKTNFIEWKESELLLTHLDDSVVDIVYDSEEIKELIKHQNVLLNLPKVIQIAKSTIRKKILAILNLSWIEDVYEKLPRALDWYSFLGPLPKSPDFFASFTPEFLLQAGATLPIGIDNENSQANFVARLFGASEENPEFCLQLINAITPNRFAFIFITGNTIINALAALSKSKAVLDAFLQKFSDHISKNIKTEHLLNFMNLLSEEQQIAWLPKFPRRVKKWLLSLNSSGTFLDALHPKAQIFCLAMWNYNLGKQTARFFRDNLKYFSDPTTVLVNFKSIDNGSYLQFLKHYFSFYLWHSIDLDSLECLLLVIKALPEDLELLHPSSFRNAIFTYVLSRNKSFNKPGLLLSLFEAIPDSFLSKHLLLKDSFTHALSELDIALATHTHKIKSHNYFAVLYALVKIYIFRVNNEAVPRYNLFNFGYSKQERLAAAEVLLEILKDPRKKINELHEKILLGSSTIKDIYEKYVAYKRAWYRPVAQQQAAPADVKEEKYEGVRPKKP